MTTLAILADIHGNLPALEAVMRDMRQFRLDHVVVAGDAINWGPFSREVVEHITREQWAVIRGNNEFYLLDYDTPRAPAAWTDRSQWPLLPWLHHQLRGRPQQLIAAWPDTLVLAYPDAPPIRVVHGSPRSHSEPIFAISTAGEIAAMLDGVREHILVSAHTHIAMDYCVNGTRILNAGSIGVPLDGHPGIARYMLLEVRDGEWRPIFRSVSYDLTPVFEAFDREHFVDECGVMGALIVKEFQTAQLQIYPFLTWRAMHHPGAPISRELLAQFLQVDARPYMPPAYRALLENTQ